jgi:hypothetical protein
MWKQCKLSNAHAKCHSLTKQNMYVNSYTLGPQKCINVLWMNDLRTFCPASKLADTATCLDFDDGQHYQNIDQMYLPHAFWGQDDVFLPSSVLRNCFRPMVDEIVAVVFAKLGEIGGHGGVSVARMSDHARHPFESVLTQNSCTHFFMARNITTINDRWESKRTGHQKPTRTNSDAPTNE